MGVQYGGTSIKMDQDDAQITFKGRTIGIKVRDFNGMGYIFGVELKNGVWENVSPFFAEFDDLYTPKKAIEQHGNALSYVKNVLVTPINEWLLTMFPSSPATLSPIDEISNVLGGFLKWVPQPNGTLQVEV
jgi:hypothetical protein